MAITRIENNKVAELIVRAADQWYRSTNLDDASAAQMALTLNAMVGDARYTSFNTLLPAEIEKDGILVRVGFQYPEPSDFHEPYETISIYFSARSVSAHDGRITHAPQEVSRSGLA